MARSDQTKTQLLKELEQLRQRVEEAKTLEEQLAQAQQALHQEQQRSQKYFDLAHVILVALDKEGTITQINRQGCELLGYSREELIGKNWFDLALPDAEREDVAGVHQKVVSGKSGSQGYHENPVVSRDGKEHIVSWRNAALVDEAGETVGALSSGLDITERVRDEQALKRQLEEMKVVHAVATAGASATSVDELIAAATQVVGETLYPDHFGVLLLDAEGKTLQAHHSYRGISEEYLQATMTIDQGVSGKVVRTGKPLRLDDVRDESTYFDIDQTMHSEVCVPLEVGGRIIGVVNAESAQLGAFSENDERLMITLAGQLATAIARVRLFEEERVRRQEADALRQAAAAITSSLNISKVLDEVLLQLENVVNYDSAAVVLKEQDSIHIVAARGFPDASRVLDTHYEPGNSLFDLIDQDLEPLILADASSDDRFEDWGDYQYTRGWMGVPLIVRGAVIGYLTIDSREKDAYGEREKKLALAFGSQAAIALDHARLFEETARRLENIAALRAIDLAITSSLDLRVTLGIILDHSLDQLKIDACSIYLLNPHTQILRFAASRGFHTGALRPLSLRLGEGYAGRAALERSTVHIPNLSEVGEQDGEASALAREGLVSYHAVPLVAKGDVKGVLEIFKRNVYRPDKYWQEFLEAIAGQAAIAIDNATLFDNLQRSRIELELAYDTTLESWVKALDLRDPQAAAHTERTTKMALQLAKRFGVPDGELIHLRRGAMLHDIGKLVVACEILNKSDPLSKDEWELIQKHPEYAYEILSSIKYLQPALDIPYCHTEHWDGTGYPRGLEGEQIPLAARIFTVAKVFDALLMDRPYRKAWSREKALQYVREEAGKHFDPDVAEAFLQMIEE